MNLLKEHQILLMKRECRVLLGHRRYNFVLLTCVLVATFFAIAFSSASEYFLKIRMDDPFTNWVNIHLKGIDIKGVEEKTIAIDSLKARLEDNSLRSYYDYKGIHTELSGASLPFVTVDGKTQLLSTIYYDNLSNSIIKEVIKSDNVIKDCTIDTSSLANSSYGIIITIDALHSLGYRDDDNLPAYISYRSRSDYADTLCVEMVDKEGVYARAPLPILAIVKRLPMNKECVSTKTFCSIIQMDLNDRPINLNNRNYAEDLLFFVPVDVNDFSDDEISGLLPEIPSISVYEYKYSDGVWKKLHPWKNGKIKLVKVKNKPPIKIYNTIEREILKHFSSRGVCRIYNYSDIKTDYEDQDNYLSVQFNTLDSIGAFEQYVKDNFNLQIEMSQVYSKNNFAVVSKMAYVLTMTMILFSLISIIIFIVNMLQNYFQKVKRNLGTFKAFGLSSKELIGVYVIIINGIVLVALALAMAVVWITQLLLPTRDAGIAYLKLWNPMTAWTVLVIFISAMACVLIVVRKLLHQTPGDLIYDR